MMFPRPLLLACLVLLTMAAPLQAQEFMPLRFSSFPGAHLSDPSPNGPAGDNLQIGFYTFGIGGMLPLTDGDTRLMGGLRYENLTIDLLDDDGTLLFTPDFLHYLRADFLLFQRLSPQWTLGLTFSPGIASDFKQLGADDWRIQTSALLLRRANERLGYGFGVSYLNDFGTPLLIPLLKVDYESASNVKVAALLPVNAYLGYALGSRNEIGLTANVSGTQYNLNVDEYDLVASRVPDDTDLPAKYSVLTVGPTFKHRLRGPFFLVAESGVTLWRRFEFDGEQINTTLDQDRSLFFRLGVAFRPPFNVY